MLLGKPVNATNVEIKFIGSFLLILGIGLQTAEFVGWFATIVEALKSEIVTLGAFAYGIIGFQLIIYIYGIRFIFTDSLPVKFIMLPLLYVYFIAAFALSVFFFIQVASQGSGAANFIALVLEGVFFGSDLLMAGGVIYLIQNYVEPAPTPAIPEGCILVTEEEAKKML